MRRVALAGILFSAAAIAVVLWRIDLSAVEAAFAGAHAGGLLLFALLQALQIPVRALRWRAVLAGAGRATPTMPLARAYSIGYLANAVLPARLGELARIAVAARRLGAPFSEIFATVALERLLDLAALGAIIGGGAAAAGVLLPAWAHRAGEVGFGLAAAGAVAFGILRLARPAFFDRYAFLERFRAGLAPIGHPRTFALALLATAAAWSCEIASLGALLSSLDLELAPAALAIAAALVSLGIAVPSGPSNLGTQQIAFALALGIFGVAAPQAIAASLLAQVILLALFGSLGVASLAREGVTLADVRRRAAESRGESAR